MVSSGFSCSIRKLGAFNPRIFLFFGSFPLDPIEYNTFRPAESLEKYQLLLIDKCTYFGRYFHGMLYSAKI